MYPVLFDLDLGRYGKFTIGTYGLFYALGFLLALRLAVVHKRISLERRQELVKSLREIPDGIRQVLAMDREIAGLARKYSRFRNFMYAGRGINHKASPSASTPPNARGAFARRAGRTSGSDRRRRGSAARTSSPAAG